MLKSELHAFFPLKSAVLPVLTLLEFLALPSQVFHCLMMTRMLARAASFASWLLADSRCVASFNGSTLPCPKSPQSWTVLSEVVPWLPTNLTAGLPGQEKAALARSDNNVCVLPRRSLARPTVQTWTMFVSQQSSSPDTTLKAFSPS